LGKAQGRILGPAQKGWLKQGRPGKTVDGGLQFVMLVVDEFTVLLLIWKPVLPCKLRCGELLTDWI